MGKKKDKVYAVARGLTPGVYFSWDECKTQTNGYPGAVFKSFEDMDSAEQYLEDYDTAQEASRQARGEMNMTENELKEKYSGSGCAFAFVDGSYYDPARKYSFGGVLIHNGMSEEFAEAGCDPELVSMRNVAGEILGAQKAMELCVEKGIRELNLYFDYEGIEKWCIGAWQCNKTGTIAYKQYYDSIRDKLKVNFVKVKGHTGVCLNEKVDMLAKRALGLA